MNRPYQYFSALLLSAALAAPVITTGCAGARIRVYDSYHNDYHRWDADEDRYYRQWEVEVRLPHREFRDRDGDEQRRYWDWRHSRGDQDRDKNRDRDRKDKDRR